MSLTAREMISKDINKRFNIKYKIKNYENSHLSNRASSILY